MNTWLHFAGWLAGAYLLGALPSGLLIARLRGVDIRAVGSKNIGATNVFRSVGPGWGVLTFLCDALKGLAPTLLFPLLGGLLTRPGLPDAVPPGLLFGAAAILGHNFPVYLGFKGGKGVATSAGVLLGIAPAAAVIGLLGWLALFLTTRYVSVASMGAAVLVPAAGWWQYAGDGLALPATLTLLGGLVIWRHRENMQRLLRGTEPRVQRGSRGPGAADEGSNQ
ncbi:MAG: glycerol-3-phosphate 1-O-acyltransferase PlsY [Kiritimatiellaeota bacterium]|nr:glycerol-3-phosphate 1-O-acyltransferase PlsY [Kiritimatiellota bacterium]